MAQRPLVSGLLRALVLALPLFALTPPRAARAAEPVRGLLFRGDLSAQTGFYYHNIAESLGGNYESNAAALGPRLELNVGYAPSQLIRLGLGGGADFAYHLGAGHQGIPGGQVDGWMRWSLGPSIGFRFGASVPLELEIGVAFAQSMFYGSQTWPGSADGLSYDFSGVTSGVSQRVLLIYRPSGADSLWALHTGPSGGFGYLQTNRGPGDSLSETGVTGSWLFGASVGL